MACLSKTLPTIACINFSSKTVSLGGCEEGEREGRTKGRWKEEK